MIQLEVSNRYLDEGRLKVGHIQWLNNKQFNISKKYSLYFKIIDVLASKNLSKIINTSQNQEAIQFVAHS